MNVDVSSLSNDELKSMLNKFGVSPGPIVGTTRRVYENKLKKLLLTSNGSSSSPPPSSDQDISVILDDNSIDLTSPQPLESTRDDEVIIVNGGGYGRSYAAPPARRTPSPPPAQFKSPSPAQYRQQNSPTNIFSSSSASPSPATGHFSVVRTPPTTVEDEDDRMEGEERIRFVAPPTFADEDDDVRMMDFGEEETTKIRQRTNIGAGHTPKLYPSLEPSTPSPRPSWRQDYGSFDRQFSGAGDSKNVSSLSKPSVSARKAMPSDLYTIGKSKSTGLPIWVKIALCFLITIFVVMLTRRLLDDGDDQETAHFDE